MNSGNKIFSQCDQYAKYLDDLFLVKRSFELLDMTLQA